MITHVCFCNLHASVAILPQAIQSFPLTLPLSGSIMASQSDTYKGIQLIGLKAVHEAQQGIFNLLNRQFLYPPGTMNGKQLYMTADESITLWYNLETSYLHDGTILYVGWTLQLGFESGPGNLLGYAAPCSSSAPPVLGWFMPYTDEWPCKARACQESQPAEPVAVAPASSQHLGSQDMPELMPQPKQMPKPQ